MKRKSKIARNETEHGRTGASSLVASPQFGSLLGMSSAAENLTFCCRTEGTRWECHWTRRLKTFTNSLPTTKVKSRGSKQCQQISSELRMWNGKMHLNIPSLNQLSNITHRSMMSRQTILARFQLADPSYKPRCLYDTHSSIDHPMIPWITTRYAGILHIRNSLQWTRIPPHQSDPSESTAGSTTRSLFRGLRWSGHTTTPSWRDQCSTATSTSAMWWAYSSLWCTRFATTLSRAFCVRMRYSNSSRLIWCGTVSV